MAVDIEAIWVALAERLALIDGVKSVSRRQKTWQPEELPAIEILDDAGDEGMVDAESRASDGLPPSYTLRGEIFVYGRTVQTDASPTTQVNTLVRAVKAKLERQETDPLGVGPFSGDLHHWTNLGGLVRYCMVTKIEKGSGAVTGSATARIEIEMETPPAG